MTTLRVGIASYEQYKERTMAIVRGEYKVAPDEPKVWFSSIESFAKVLSERNRELLRVIAGTKPQSLAELAKRTGRAKSNLSRTLKTMERYGLVTFAKGKGRTLMPRTPYTEVVLDLSLRAKRGKRRTLVPAPIRGQRPQIKHVRHATQSLRQCLQGCYTMAARSRKRPLAGTLNGNAAMANEPTRENPCGPIGTAVIYENDQVRVWDMEVPAGGKKAWHHHTMDYVIINVTGGKIELENVNGHTIIADDKVGGVIWRDAGEKHELRNLSGRPYRNILVELKNGKQG